MNPKHKPQSSHAIYHKQDQNLMKNKKVTGFCIEKNWKISRAANFRLCDDTKSWLNMHQTLSSGYLFNFVFISLILLLEIVDFEKKLYSLQWNWGIYWLFKVYRKLINYSKWRPPSAYQKSEFRFSDCHNFLMQNPITFGFVADCVV